jgi:phospholipase/lecithinase/hemolysin
LRPQPGSKPESFCISSPSENPKTYLFYDGLHPTGEAHRLIMEDFVDSALIGPKLLGKLEAPKPASADGKGGKGGKKALRRLLNAVF